MIVSVGLYERDAVEKRLVYGRNPKPTDMRVIKLGLIAEAPGLQRRDAGNWMRQHGLRAEDKTVHGVMA